MRALVNWHKSGNCDAVHTGKKISYFDDEMVRLADVKERRDTAMRNLLLYAPLTRE